MLRSLKRGRPLCIVILFLMAGCATTEDNDMNLGPGAANSTGTRLTPQPSAPSQAGPLTLAMAIRRAWTADGPIAVLKAAIAVADETKNAAADWRDPELRVSYNDGTGELTATSSDLGPDGQSLMTREDESSTSFSAGLRFFPPNPWIRSARMSAGEAARNAARMDLKAAEWAVAMEITRLFTDIRYLSGDAAILDQLVGVYDDNLKLCRERAQASQATALDLLKVAQQRLQALATRDRVRRKLSENQRLLASRVNLPIERLVLAVPSAHLEPTKLKTLTMDQLEARAMEERHDLSALHWRSLEAEAVCKEARAERIPWFSFIQATCAGGERNQRAGDIEYTSRESRDSAEWRFDIGVTLPLFSWANHAPALRDAEHSQAVTDLREAIENADRSVRERLEAVRSLGDLRAQYVAESDPLLRELETALKSLVNDTDVLPDQIGAVREQLLLLRRSRLEQDYEYEKGVVALEDVMGMWLAPVASR